jgi:signal transduction histidine kinase
MSDHSMFETLLASSVHDMKNSLSLLLSQLDGISEKLDAEAETRRSGSDLRYQASRINVSLMELLSLYKLEKKQIGVNLTDVFVADFLEDCIAVHSQLAQHQGTSLSMRCDDELMWFFDPDLVGIALNNIVGNCLRYTHSQVEINARIVDGVLQIHVDDDGRGYPEAMTGDITAAGGDVNAHTGSTGLGLYFAHTIAQEHKRQGRHGYIRLTNDAAIGGGSFLIALP